MINFWKMTVETVKKQRDQYKAERDTLIDDIAVLKANNDRYRKRAENFKDYAERYQYEVVRLERENEKNDEYIRELRAQQGSREYMEVLERENEKIRKHNKGLQLKADGFFNKWVNDRNLLSEISQHIGNKPSSSTYRYFRAKLDGIGIKEGE
ncbi:hypothetical protein [Staphylococcus equorum]|uniref:hypothetical protein n=1 Tax=Staphylococcus equorum TaxID=246432 RepID=UPI003CE8ECC1